MQVIAAPHKLLTSATHPDAVALRTQFRAKEDGHRTREAAILSAAKPADIQSLKDDFRTSRKQRAERYAAVLCSVADWAPRVGARTESKVLTAFYGLVGQRARELAKSEGVPFAMEHVERVKLTKADVVSLRQTYGDADVKKAWPMLQRHIAHERFLDAGALSFVNSGEFLMYQTALDRVRDSVEHNIVAHREELSAKDAQALFELRKQQDSRVLAGWTDDVVVTRPSDSADQDRKISYVSVGGHLVRVTDLED